MNDWRRHVELTKTERRLIIFIALLFLLGVIAREVLQRKYTASETPAAASHES